MELRNIFVNKLSIFKSKFHVDILMVEHLQDHLLFTSQDISTLNFVLAGVPKLFWASEPGFGS